MVSKEKFIYTFNRLLLKERKWTKIFTIITLEEATSTGQVQALWQEAPKASM